MSVLDNLTPFAATCLPSVSVRDELLTLVVVAGRFHLPSPGTSQIRPVHITDEQPPVGLDDRYNGDPANSSLRFEGQSAAHRPGTDIYIDGFAWSPGGRPVSSSAVRVRIGALQKTAAVFGDRVWRATAVGLRPTEPQPFTELPLTYERSFGGSPSDASGAIAEVADRNPVGRGLYTRDADAADRPLPNFEDPADLIRSPGDRPQPCGFGPIARHWTPRKLFAGTYDERWVDERMPLWPHDIDDRFFCAASPGLCAFPHLRGGEPVEIIGMSPDGSHLLELPQVRLEARFEMNDSSIRRQLVLDAIWFEIERGSFTMFWRTAAVCNPLSVGLVVVRCLESWEAA